MTLSRRTTEAMQKDRAARKAAHWKREAAALRLAA